MAANKEPAWRNTPMSGTANADSTADGITWHAVAVDDVVKRVVATNGSIDPAVEYLGKFEGHWLGVPMTRGTLLLGCCSRFDMMKEYAGVDVQELYPEIGRAHV